MVDTIHLRARGLGHRIAFDRTVLAHDTPLNRGLLASVRQVEQIARGTDLVGKDLTKARVLSMVFEDCLDGRFLTTPRRAFLADLEVAQRDPFAKRNRDLAALAAAVLDRVSLDEPDPSAGLVPRAWFLDLGRLFEDVVTRELRSVVAPGLRVEEGSTTLPRMFDAVSNRYRADPDLVVKQGMRTVVVGDVKHKSWTGIASEDDLYQLLAHTAAFGARDCFLIYPHVSFEEVSLGINPLGGKTRLFAVDVKQLDRDLALVADGLGLARLGAAA
jgi:McrBC 5-methylcytosine restriction system component